MGMSVEMVVMETLLELDVEYAELRSTTRRPRVVLARDLISYIARLETTASYPAIARAIGSRSHATAMDARRRLERRLDQEAGQRQAAAARPVHEHVARIRASLGRAA